MKKITLDVVGMHCKSCEILIENEIKKDKLVKDVKASTKKQQVYIEAKDQYNVEAAKDAIIKLGYSLGKEELPFITKDKGIYKNLLTAILYFIAFYLLIITIGLDKIVGVNFGSNKNLGIVLLVGLTAGFSSCMALVGGLILGISTSYLEKHPNLKPAQKIRPHIFFNLGRVASYFLLGGVIGSFGSVLRLSGRGLGIVTLLVGLVMIFLGAQLIEVFPKISGISIRIPDFLTEKLGLKSKQNSEYSHFNSLILGGLTFFLPCGFTQSMQVLAISSGNFLSGALIMGAFAIGTIPGLLGVGTLVSFVKKGNISDIFFKFVGVLLIALSIFNFSNGLSLLGIRLPEFKPAAVPVAQDTVVENGVQIVRMTQDSTGYHPSNFVIKKNIPVKWIVTSNDQSTCSSSIFVPSYGIEKVLSKGENEIDFTPTASGRINFSCSMGMYRGYFIVND